MFRILGIHRFLFPKNSQFSYQTNTCFLRNRMITLCAVGRFIFRLAEVNFLITKFLKLRDVSLFLHSRLLDLHSFVQKNVQIVRYENENDAGPLVTATPYSVVLVWMFLEVASSRDQLSLPLRFLRVLPRGWIRSLGIRSQPRNKVRPFCHGASGALGPIKRRLSRLRPTTTLAA